VLKTLGRDEEADNCIQKANELRHKIAEERLTKKPMPSHNKD